MTEIAWAGSVLGHFAEVYSDEEKELCRKIATFLKMRWDKGKATRDDMDFFVRAGASLYELAKQLNSLGPQSRRAVPKTAEDWLQIITGNRFHYYTDPNLVKNILDITVSGPSNDGAIDVEVCLPSAQSKTVEELDDGRAVPDHNPAAPGCIDVDHSSGADARGGDRQTQEDTDCD